MVVRDRERQSHVFRPLGFRFFLATDGLTGLDGMEVMRWAAAAAAGRVTEGVSRSVVALSTRSSIHKRRRHRGSENMKLRQNSAITPTLALVTLEVEHLTMSESPSLSAGPHSVTHQRNQGADVPPTEALCRQLERI